MTDVMMMELGTLVAAMQKRKIIAIIPARGGSKRLPRKNIYPIWGMPMVYWAIKACKESELISDVWVSSEDDEIKEAAMKYGAKIHHRSKDLADHRVYKMEAIRSAAKHIESIHGTVDVFVSLQANSPQITSQILDSAIDIFEKHNRNELISVDSNFMQNAAFRILRGQHVYQTELSTKCGVFVHDLLDVHTIDDVGFLEKKGR